MNFLGLQGFLSLLALCFLRKTDPSFLYRLNVMSTRFFIYQTHPGIYRTSTIPTKVRTGMCFKLTNNIDKVDIGDAEDHHWSKLYLHVVVYKSTCMCRSLSAVTHVSKC